MHVVGSSSSSSKNASATTVLERFQKARMLNELAGIDSGSNAILAALQTTTTGAANKKSSNNSSSKRRSRPPHAATARRNEKALASCDGTAATEESTIAFNSSLSEFEDSFFSNAGKNNHDSTNYNNDGSFCFNDSFLASDAVDRFNESFESSTAAASSAQFSLHMSASSPDDLERSFNLDNIESSFSSNNGYGSYNNRYGNSCNNFQSLTNDAGSNIRAWGTTTTTSTTTTTTTTTPKCADKKPARCQPKNVEKFLSDRGFGTCSLPEADSMHTRSAVVHPIISTTSARDASLLFCSKTLQNLRDDDDDDNDSVLDFTDFFPSSKGRGGVSEKKNNVEKPLAEATSKRRNKLRNASSCEDEHERNAKKKHSTRRRRKRGTSVPRRGTKANELSEQE